MKNILNKLILLLFIALAFPNFGASQDSVANELNFDVNRVYSTPSITKEQLKEAQNLVELDRWCKSSWVKDYISVEVLTSYKGKIKKVVSKNDSIHQELRDFINRADAGTDISVNVQYIPNNVLPQNDAQELNFSFKIDPESEAQYPGGPQELKKYLKKNAIDKIPEGRFTGYDFVAVNFTISEEGQVIDAHVFDQNIFNASKDEKIDELLLEAIRKMPCWEPATYSNGVTVKQEFVFLVGNMQNCVIPLLNTRRYW